MAQIFLKKRCFIIAEAGINHNGSLRIAKRLVDAAKEADADAVKFQTFKAENVVSIFAEKADYQKRTTNERSQFEMLKKLELRYKDFEKIKEYCDKKKIVFLSSPFDFESIDFLYKLLPLYKIPSGEITNIPYLEYIARKNKPIIMSTGMSTINDIREALKAIRKYNKKDIALLHCVSNYPANFKEINLNAMLTLKKVFKVPVGFSDHTLGIEASIAAVALGAIVIEKHLTLNRNYSGPDHKASIEPEEFKVLVDAIRNIEKALGDGVKKNSHSELEVMKKARKSLVAARDIKAGEVLGEENVSIKRPGTGIPPKYQKKVIGMKCIKNIKKDKPFKWENLE